MNIKKRTILIVSLIIVMLIILVGTVTYAFFSTNISGLQNLNATAGMSSEASKLFAVLPSGNLSMEVNDVDMLSAISSNEVPAKSAVSTIDVILNAGTNQKQHICMYDLAWYDTGTDHYTPSNNLGDNKEYTLKVVDNDNNIILEETNINNLTSGMILTSDSIISSGSNVTKTYTATSSIYNLNIPQNIGGKSYSSEIRAINVRCGEYAIIYRSNEYVGNLYTTYNHVVGNQWIYYDSNAYQTYTYNTQELCQARHSSGCTLQNGEYDGIGPYYTSLEETLTHGHTVYCSTTSSSCSFSDALQTREDCEYGTRTCYAHEYDLDPHIYFKHVTMDGSIMSTELCVYYNDSEFCLLGHEWVDGDEDGTTSMPLLESKIKSTLGDSLSCEVSYGNIYCYPPNNDEHWFSVSVYIDYYSGEEINELMLSSGITCALENERSVCYLSY